MLYRQRIFRNATLQFCFIVAIFATIGVSLLVSTHATTATVQFEPENGAPQGNVAVIADPTASGGKVIRFGTAIRNIDDRGYGISANFQWMSAADQTSFIATMKDLGMTWVRMDIAWATVQPTDANTYDWSSYDTAIAKLTAAGIKVDGIIDYSSPWARTATCSSIQSNLCGPADPTQYATYAKAVDQHFGSKLGAMEIWNEPDITQFWRPAPDSSAYATLLKDAYTAVKSVDPGMLIISAGLSPAGGGATTYANGMYTNNAKDSFDVFGYHPYSYPAPASQYQPWSGWSQYSQTATNIRSVMTANGDSAKSVWFTEVGAPSGGPGVVSTCADAVANAYTSGSDHVDECLQARIDSEAISVGRSYSNVGVIFLYTFKDPSTDSSTRENFFGLIRPDGTQKPSYAAVKQAIAANPEAAQ